MYKHFYKKQWFTFNLTSSKEIPACAGKTVGALSEQHYAKDIPAFAGKTVGALSEQHYAKDIPAFAGKT